jgi:hypothetical protein
MTEQIKLLLALDQIENITSLLNGNEYQDYIYNHLIQIQVELKRQLTCLQHSAKIKE